MTRRDFQLIAGVVLEHVDEMPHETYARMVRRFGDELFGTNPRFDRGRFERACGLAFGGLGALRIQPNGDPLK